MYKFRPRFGMPSFGDDGRQRQQARLDRLPLSVESGLRLPGRLAAVLIAASLAVSACSSAGDTTASDPDAIEDGGSGATDEDSAQPSGETEVDDLSFGDPAEAGFDAVVDVEVEPEPTPTEESETLPTPEEILPEIDEQLEDVVVAPDGEQDILDTVEVVDVAAETPDDRDGRSRNSSGELVTLDEAASLACAHVEVAFTMLDEGNDAVALERIWSAADRAGSSDIGAVRAWQEPLAEVIAEGTIADVAPLVGFITVCAEGGYEL